MDNLPPSDPVPPPAPPPPALPPYTPPPYTPPPTPGPAAPVALTPSDERTLAMIAHLSNLLNLVTGFLGVLVPLGMYLIYKDRSRYVAYHSLQSFVFQLIAWLAGGALAVAAWAVAGTLTMVLIGFCLMPIALLVSLLPLISLIYSIYAGIECSQGRDFRYWLVGDWVRGTLTNP